MTTLVLQIKASGANVLWLPLDGNTNFAIMTGLKQAGVKIKVVINATGYGQVLLNDTDSAPSAQGAWFLVTGVPIESKTPATKAFQSALAKYAHYTGVPDFTWYEGWGGADLMIKGLELAGKNPTRSAFIADLHKVTDYSANGLFGPVSFSLSDFGKAPKTLCEYLVQLEGNDVRTPDQGVWRDLAELRPAPECMTGRTLRRSLRPGHEQWIGGSGHSEDLGSVLLEDEPCGDRGIKRSLESLEVFRLALGIERRQRDLIEGLGTAEKHREGLSALAEARQ